MTREPLIGWIERWYESECNGDWEHQFGIKIETIDNPGWQVEIDLFETELHDVSIEYGLEQRTDQDWLGSSVSKQQFCGVGDPSKLEIILDRFRQLVQHNRQGELVRYLSETYPSRWTVTQARTAP